MQTTNAQKISVQQKQNSYQQHDNNNNTRKSSSSSQQQNSRNTSNEIKMTLNQYLQSVNLKRRISSRSKDKKRPSSYSSNNYFNSNNNNIGGSSFIIGEQQQPARIQTTNTTNTNTNTRINYLQPPPIIPPSKQSTNSFTNPTPTNPTLQYHKLNQQWKSRKLFSTWIIELKQLCRQYIKKDDEYVEVIRLIEKISEFVKGEIETIKRDNLLLESFLVMEASYWVEGDVGNNGNIDGESNINGQANGNNNNNNNNNFNNNTNNNTDRLSNYIKAVLSSRSDCYSQYNNNSSPLKTAKSIQQRLVNNNKNKQSNQHHQMNTINNEDAQMMMLHSPQRNEYKISNDYHQYIPTGKKIDYKTSTQPKSQSTRNQQQQQSCNNNNNVARFSSSSTGKMYYLDSNNNNNQQSLTSINDQSNNNTHHHHENNDKTNNKQQREHILYMNDNNKNIGSIKQLSMNNNKINKSLQSTNRLNKHYIYSFNDKHQNNINNTLRTNTRQQQPTINPFIQQSQNNNYHQAYKHMDGNNHLHINSPLKQQQYYQVGLLKINSRNYNIDNNTDDVPRLSLMSRYDQNTKGNLQLQEKQMGDKFNHVKFHTGNDNSNNNNVNNNMNNTNNSNNMSNRQPPLRERKQKLYKNKLSSPQYQQLQNHFEMVKIAGGINNNSFNPNNKNNNSCNQQITDSIKKVQTKMVNNNSHYNNNINYNNKHNTHQDNDPYNTHQDNNNNYNSHQDNDPYNNNPLHSTPSILRQSPHIVSIQTPSTLRRRYPSSSQHYTNKQPTIQKQHLQPDQQQQRYHISVRNPHHHVQAYSYQNNNKNKNMDNINKYSYNNNNRMNKSSIIVQNHNGHNNNYQLKTTTSTSNRRQNIMSRYDNFKQPNHNNHN